MSQAAHERPWWLNWEVRPPEFERIAQALVDEGLCAWDARGKPHPQEYALVALWALRGDHEVERRRKGA